MKSKQPSPARTPSLVVVPPPPAGKALSTAAAAAQKRPAAPRSSSGARDAQGKASRNEIRREEPRRAAPCATGRTPERGNQPRSHKSGKK